MQYITYAAIAVFLIGAAAFSLWESFRKINKKGTDGPALPGPTLLPYIGRIHDLPIPYMWLKFKEWADKFGPIYYTEMMGAKFIIISDEKIAEELLVHRAKFNSDRPMMRSVTDSKSTEGGMEYLPLMGRNQYWARQRRLVHSYVTEAANNQWYGVINHEAKRWLYLLATNPDNFMFSLEDMASKVMAQLTWDDPDQSEYLAGSAWKLLTQMSPAGPITNLITPLWSLPVPINPWKKAEKIRRDEQSAWWMDRYNHTKEQHQKGEARASWTKTYLQIEKNHPLSGDKEASAAIGMLAVVGIFTVAGPLHYFLLAMLCHPEWQAKVQKEIDEVCKGKLPTLDDSPNLPILRACIKETMRWRPNVPTGVAHEAEQDDWYQGQFIPKGARLLPLDWAFLRNPVKYPDPDHYRPERWLEAEWPTYQEPLSQFPTIKGMTSFGFGRRTCLGQDLTRDELLVACGALMWGFNLTKRIDPATGKPIEVDTMKSNHLLIIKPDPYVMDVKPRSEEKRAEIMQIWAEADAQDRREREEFVALARQLRA